MPNCIIWDVAKAPAERRFDVTKYVVFGRHFGVSGQESSYNEQLEGPRRRKVLALLASMRVYPTPPITS